MTELEAGLLEYLWRHRDRLVTQDELLVEVWGYSQGVRSRAVKDLVSRLRRKLEPTDRRGQYLVSSYGQGFRLQNVHALDDADTPLPPSPVSPTATAPTVPLDRFFGRETERAAVAQRWTAGHRLVTLIGPGGVGKTRLATHCVQAEDRPVIMVDLSDADTYSAAITRVSAALSTPLAAGDADAWTRQLGAALAGRGPLLLLLDNLEQVLSLARSIRAWLLDAPDLRILGTSRTRLGVRGERAIEVLPLSPDVAHALFVDRLDGAGGDHTEVGIDALLDELDGLPLALEMAAAQVARMGTAALIKRLRTARLRLSHRTTGVPERHSSLDATFAWSWERLNDAQRNALCVLSLFRGGAPLAGVQSVLGEDALDRVDELVDRSLVRVDRTHRSEARVTMLRVVHAFASRARDAHPDNLLWQGAHARWAVRVGEALLANPDRPSALPRLSREASNLLAAATNARGLGDPDLSARAALAMAPHLRLRGPIGTLQELLDDALIDTLSPDLRARALLARGEEREHCGSANDAIADLYRARRSAPHGPNQVRIDSTIARLQARQGLSADAETRLLAAISAANDLGDPALAASVQANYGNMLNTWGRHADAITHLRAALPPLRAAGHLDAEARALGGLGSALRALGDPAGAAHHLTEAQAIFSALHDRRGEALCQSHLGHLAAASGQTTTAQNHWQAALASHIDIGNRQGEAVVRINLALIAVTKGEVVDAARLTRAARRIQLELGGTRAAALAAGNLGLIALRAGDPLTAAGSLTEALTELEAHPLPPAQACFSAMLAAAEGLRGRRDAAESALSASVGFESADSSIRQVCAAIMAVGLEGVDTQDSRVQAALHLSPKGRHAGEEDLPVLQEVLRAAAHAAR